MLLLKQCPMSSVHNIRFPGVLVTNCDDLPKVEKWLLMKQLAII